MRCSPNAAGVVACGSQTRVLAISWIRYGREVPIAKQVAIEKCFRALDAVGVGGDEAHKGPGHDRRIADAAMGIATL